MAYLKSTNIDGDLSVTGEVTLAGQLIRESSNDDYYLGYGQNTYNITELNDCLQPFIGYFSSTQVESGIGNWPGNDGGKLIVLQVSTSNIIQIVIQTNNVIHFRSGANVDSNPQFTKWFAVSTRDYKSILGNTSFRSNVQTFSYLSAIPWYTSGMSTYALLTATPNYCSYNVIANPDSGSNLSDAPASYGIIEVFAGSANYRMAMFRQVTISAVVYVYAIGGDHSPGSWKQLNMR